MDSVSRRALHLARAATAPASVPISHAQALVAPLRADLRRNVRRSLGVPAEPPPRKAVHDDAFMPPGGMARQVHGDLASMVVGGLAALLLQSLHPLVMAGVADHSNYRHDPVGRLRRTASFIGMTTFGTQSEAASAIERVREVHRGVTGRAPDGRPYAAYDPDLLTWVHVAEVASFMRAAQLFGPRRFSEEEQDRYFDETARVARELGAEWAPRTANEVDAYLLRVRPDLYAGRQALEARDFLLQGVARRPMDRAVYGAIVAAALCVLPGWARAELKIVMPPLLDHVVIAPVSRGFCAMLRWTVTPPAAETGGDQPSTDGAPMHPPIGRPARAR